MMSPLAVMIKNEVPISRYAKVYDFNILYDTNYDPISRYDTNDNPFSHSGKNDDPISRYDIKYISKLIFFNKKVLN